MGICASSHRSISGKRVESLVSRLFKWGSSDTYGSVWEKIRILLDENKLWDNIYILNWKQNSYLRSIYLVYDDSLPDDQLSEDAYKRIDTKDFAEHHT